jgi:hypothetical protein
MNIIRRSSGYLPDGTTIYIEDWTPDKIEYHPYVVAAFPVSKVTLPGTWSPDAGRKFRYGMTFETFREAAECADRLTRGEAKLGDYADHLERAEYAQCV